jgi:tryptophan synthase alpha chain
MPIEFNSKPGLKPGLVIYLTAGDPDLATTRDVALAAIDAGAEVLELGVPFSDPLADGPVIQRASERALGPRYKPARRAGPGCGIARPEALRRPGDLLLFQSHLAFRAGALLRPCRQLRRGWRIDHRHDRGRGRRVSDGNAPQRADADFSGCAHQQRSPAEDDRGVSEGFVYAISRVGITGAQQNLAADARRLVERLRRFTQLPIAVGFGISTAEHVAAVGEFADAAVIGTAIVSLIEKAEPGTAPARIAAFLQGLRQPQQTAPAW